ncbi:hypothetical protein Celaphus_00007407, partial [Cervus elaphus hippelaphus]
VLLIFWFYMKPITSMGCFLQMFVINTFLPVESSAFVDLYVAVCIPLHYPSIITVPFVISAAIFILLLSLLATLPTPVLAARLNYYASNVVGNGASISIAKSP